jgi:hypothetical protein
MDLLFSLGFVLVGVACLWAAFTGKTVYNGRALRQRTPRTNA